MEERHPFTAVGAATATRAGAEKRATVDAVENSSRGAGGGEGATGSVSTRTRRTREAMLARA